MIAPQNVTWTSCDPQIANASWLSCMAVSPHWMTHAAIGEALKGPKWGGFWKHRGGDYRIISSIEASVLRILVVKIGNRRAVYR